MLLCAWRETTGLMNGLSVLDPDGSRACLIGFHEDRDPRGVRRGEAAIDVEGGGGGE